MKPYVQRVKFEVSYEDIISIENILAAWTEFLRGKRRKYDVQEFGRYLITNVVSLHRDLANKSYTHGGYRAFKIADPKPRDIHKASVRDRLLHHALYRTLYPFFERTFIVDSYSCRKNKGTHLAMNRFKSFANKVSKNNTRTCWVLKCDIRKFFASIDQSVLWNILYGYIPDPNTRWLIDQVIKSFSSTQIGKGLPLGNLTSQLLVNVYMNEFDQFAKHQLKAKYYIRYADDFVFLSDNQTWLENLVPRIQEFLQTQLKLELHPDKLSISTLVGGVDFLGWIHFPDHRTLRTNTRRRMIRKLSKEVPPAVAYSYAGMLTHGNTYKLQRHAILNTNG